MEMEVILIINYNQMDKGLSQYAWYKPGNLLGMFENMTSSIVG